MKKQAIISVAQIRYYDSFEKHNVDKIKKYIYLAKKAKSDIVCFPETCVHKTSYLELNNKLIKEIQKSCKENSIWAIITDSFIVNKKPYKIALLIDRNGKIRGKYKKINLYGDDTKAGKKIFTYQTDFAKIGIVICWDLAFPDLFKKMKKAGAEIVFCPSKWCYEKETYEKDHKKNEIILLRSLVKSRAFENIYFLAFSNPVIKEKKYTDLVSYSAIASPHKILKEIIDKEGLITAKINLEEINKFTKLYNQS